MAENSPSSTVRMERVRQHSGGESSYYLYRCEMGGSVSVEVELGGFDTIREEFGDVRCERCCRPDGDWDGSLSVRRVRPCWKSTRPGRDCLSEKELLEAQRFRDFLPTKNGCTVFTLKGHDNTDEA